jgi:hypothetical protein
VKRPRTPISTTLGTPLAYTSRILAWSGSHASSGHASHAGTPIGGAAKLRDDQLSDTASSTMAGPVKSANTGSGNANPRLRAPLPCRGGASAGPPGMTGGHESVSPNRDSSPSRAPVPEVRTAPMTMVRGWGWGSDGRWRGVTAGVSRAAGSLWYRPVAAAYAALLLSVSVLSVPSQPMGGQDFAMYRDAAARWLSGGGFYLPHQLAGPYPVTMGDVLYPPTSLLLLAPFTVLPAILWWAVPLGLLAVALWRLRPAPWAWPLMALCAGFFQTRNLVAAGNPDMWLAAALAWGVSPAVLLKPTLAPLALAGIRSRRWWVALAAVAVGSLAFLPMWADYLRVLANAQDSRPALLHSLADVPFLLLPLVARAARPRSASRAAAAEQEPRDR